MVGRLLTDTRALPPGAPDEEMLRVGVRAFLAFPAGRSCPTPEAAWHPRQTCMGWSRQTCMGWL